MKNTICLLMILCGLTGTAQKNISIEEQWKRIEEQISEGKFSSLQPDINRVLEQARKEKDYPNAIKALFYDAKIKIVTSDERVGNFEYIFERLEGELKQSTGASKAIIEVYLATLYTMYYSENQWTINSRTPVENQDSKDLKTWTANTFWDKANEYYERALVDKKLLQRNKITDWKETFIWPSAVEMKVDFSVYELLSFRYISFLNSNQFRLPKELVSSNRQKAQVLLSELIADFQKRKDREGEIYARLFELQVQNENDDFKSTSEKYRLLVEKYPQLPANVYIYRNWINNLYQVTANSEKKASYDLILDLIKKVQHDFPDSSDLNSDLIQLENQIHSSNLKVLCEKYLIANRNNPIEIEHKNTDKLFFKVLKYTGDSFDFDERWDNYSNKYKASYYQKYIDAYPVVTESQISLKAFDDFNRHKTIVNLSPLPQGAYLILTSDKPFSDLNDDSTVVMNSVYMTTSALLFDDHKVRVFDRYTGKPLANQPLMIYREDYTGIADVQGEALKKIWKKEVISDSKGTYVFDFSNEDEDDYYFSIKGEEVYYSYDFSVEDDVKNEQSSHTNIFTDRAIYRPGQTVYFKAIITAINAQKKLRIIADQKVEISLRDANYKVIQTLNLITNEFGSAQGEFVLPQSGLLGYYSLQSSLDGYKGFSVEEYKRPKFEVLLDTLKGNHHFGDEIKVSGKASAFSGADIDQGKVTYRVFRQAYSFDPFYRTPHGYRNSDSEEIAFGTLLTDANGRFEIPFKAIAADQKEDNPRTYSYRVEVAVMDDNGETHTAESAVLIGDLGLSFTYNLPEVITPDQLNQFAVRVTSLNGQLVSAQGGMEIHPLVAPKRVVRDSPLEMDYQHYTEEEFIQLFPHEPYGDERTPSKWDREAKILETRFDTEKTSEIHFDTTAPLIPGKYLLKSWVWDQQQKIESEQVFEVKNNAAKLEESLKTLNLEFNKANYQVGDVVHLQLFSPLEDSYAVVAVFHKNKLIKEELVSISGKKGIFEFPILESYLGGVNVNILMIKYNSLVSQNIPVEISFPQKVVNIKMATLRDKLQPGAKEKWELTISGSKKDLVLAEVLAGMYDASLDQFAKNSFGEDFMLLPSDYYYYTNEYLYDNREAFSVESESSRFRNHFFSKGTSINAATLNFYRFNFDETYVTLKRSLTGSVSGVSISKNVGVTVGDKETGNVVVDGVNVTGSFGAAPTIGIGGSQSLEEVITIKKGGEPEKFKPIEVRKNLRETAFFYPNLKTDKSGNVKIEFTMPESLTEWKFIAFAHTKDLQTGYFETRVKTQKDLMIVPNVPRFLREGDRVVVTAKIVNLLDGETAGQASLMLFDALTMKPIDHLYNNQNNLREFKLTASSSTAVNWEITVPKNSPPITYRMVAATADFSDAEESVLPVLTNRILLTETLPIFAKAGQRKTFELDALKNSSSKTLEHFKLTLEMTTNPIWMAVFSLPYLREYPYDCSEQLFGRLYGNTISQQLWNSNPKIKAVFDDWNSKGELKSPLEKNPELKNILIEETPWLRDAESDTEQKKRLALLFDWNKMQNEYGVVLEKLQKRQLSNGGFSWFDGGAVNPNITLEILSGFGSLKKMGVKKEIADSYAAIEDKTLQFLDQYYYKNYLDTKEKEQGLQNDQIQFLYARSFFLDEKPLSADLKKMAAAYVSMISEKPTESALSIKVMEVLILHRFGKTAEAKTILHQLKERAVISDEMGMYWKSNQAGWQWYQTPIETQALLIEAFDEVARDEKAVAEMKIWLLKNRATNGWKSTKATTRAVYALLNTGASPLDAASVVDIWVGKQQIDLNQEAQSGSGYTKHTWNKEAITKDQAIVTVDKQSAGTAWGALYWQYFEDLNKVDKTSTGIKIHKQMYIATNSASGPVLKAVTDSNPIKVGDKVTVRLEVTTDRDMEFVHLKDMRASGLEPINAISGYKWGNRTAYYQEIRDVATNFFIDALKKGTYVFEYELRANTAGVFSNGIATLQNMYAPEMSAHTEGVLIEIK